MPTTPLEAAHTVAAVQAGSPAARAGIRPGDRVLSVNGQATRDALDLHFYTNGGALQIELERDGLPRALLVVAEDDLGIELEPIDTDHTITCDNHCPFCFLNGLAPGMRRTLYLKDDDYRLSFLHGNFITLSNFAEEDWQRLSDQRPSPLYVSVHATDPELRRKLLGSKRAPDIREQLRRLAGLRILAHTQVVLCPGINDGDQLESTLRDLYALYPTVQSVALVPVGVTRFNAGRWRGALRPQTRQEAQDLIAQARPWQRRCRQELGCDLVYLSDEVYLRAETPVPDARRYDGFPQLDNGVGMTRRLIDDARRARVRGAGWRVEMETGEPVTLVCGTLIGPTLESLVTRLSAGSPDRSPSLRVLPVANRFFGETVTVSGLLTGADVISALGTRAPDARVVLPRAMLDQDAQRTLDDLTPADLERALGTPVSFAERLSDVFAGSGFRVPGCPPPNGTRN
ncbi:MAG: DUF512 domain-containing protein [Chloroflexi bacterium]|nr:DUF512 domain-containing protein [Chloroflexota bacterium]